VPAYIVTFSDMVTLLLTFFVLLLTLANEQDPELFNKGRDSFIKSLRYAGLGMFFGRRDMPVLGSTKTRHSIDIDERDANRRTINAEREKVRRILEQIGQFATIVPSEMVADKTRYTVTNVRFQRSEAVLDASGRKQLTEYCDAWREVGGIENTKIYVLGLAPDASGAAGQWQLSAMRAKVVADFLNDELSSQLQRPVYSWGGGPGGDWVNAESPVSEESHILIAALRSDE
jgi:outer membrane protein OmpA-like peptidoglycan-associated protein